LRPPRRSLGAIRAGLLLAAQAACLAAQVPPPRIQLPPKKAPVFPVIAMAPQAVAAGKALARLDVRGAREYAAGHATGAVRLDLGEIARACPEPEPACLRAALGSAGVSAAAPVVLFAADLETAARAFFLLEAAGCRIVRIAGGGFSAWQAAKMPVERRARKASPQPFGAPAERIAVLEAPAVLVRLGDRDFEALDLRDGGDWTANGDQAPALFAAGHVPRSLPWDPRGGLPADGSLPEPRAARAAFERLGPRADQVVDPQATFALVGAGASDPRAALAYLRLRSMGIEARVVRGGFAAWQAAGLPVVRIVAAAQVFALLDPAELAGNRLPDRVAILDLRELADYEEGHVPGAAVLPLRLLDTAGLEAAVSGRWPRFDRATAPLVLYCDGHDCIRGRDAAAIAARAGFGNVLWFREGLPAWREAGYPVAR